MAVNRYEQPAEAQFINTYVPIPFDDIMKVGLLKQARIDQDMADQEKMLTEYSSFQTAPGADERRRDEIINQMRNDIGKIQGQPGYAEWKQNFSNLRSKYASDPEIMNLKRNATPYAEMTKAEQEAQKNKITDANTLELRRTRAEFFNTGTAGLRAKTGSGQLSASSYYGNVDSREELKKWVKDVKPSSVEQMYNDKTGQYTITQKNAAITMGALGAPYGITFSTVYEHGKPVIKPNVDSFAKDGFRKIMSTEAGAQIRRDAEYELSKSGEPVTNEALTKKTFDLALSNINSIIQEKVSSDSSMKFAAEDYNMAKFKHNLTDVTDAFTYGMLMDNKGNTLTSSFAVDEAKNVLSKNILDIENKRKTIASEHGGEVTTRTITSTDSKGNIIKDSFGNPVTTTVYTGKDGQDVTADMLGTINEENSVKKQMEDIKRVETKLKGIAGIDANYTPTKESINSATEAGMNAVGALRSRTAGYNMGEDRTDQEMNPAEQKAYDNAYKTTLTRLDPKYAKYEDLLKEQSKAGLIKVGVTRFGSEKLNNTVEEDGLRQFAENKPGVLGGGLGAVEWTQSSKKGSFNNKDYENINNGLKPNFEGWAFDTGGDGRLKFIYKFQTKKSTKDKPEYMDAVKVDAPDGAAQILIREGQFDEADQYLTQLLSSDSLGPDKAMDISVKVPTPDGKEIEKFIKFSTVTADDVTHGAPSGMAYKLSFPERDGDKITDVPDYAESKQQAIAKIKGYYAKMR